MFSSFQKQAKVIIVVILLHRMQALPYRGTTSDFYRHTQNVILKKPMKVWEGNPDRASLEKKNAEAIEIERQILQVLGKHPRIVPLIGFNSDGIYLSEARLGNLQTYIDTHNAELSPSQRSGICEQIADAIVHTHKMGVVHSDLRPENILVDQLDTSSLSVWLCDFGGSTCEGLGLDGGHLPDTPFFDPPNEMGINTSNRYLQLRVDLLHHSNRTLAVQRSSTFMEFCRRETGL
ncbi:hypothetical protein PG990_013089 [Apiospora arundinis]